MTKRVAWFTGEPSVKECFTPYKVYEVVREEATNFSVINDKGVQNFCLNKGCAHICQTNWVVADIVEEGKVETLKRIGVVDLLPEDSEFTLGQEVIVVDSALYSGKAILRGCEYNRDGSFDGYIVETPEKCGSPNDGGLCKEGFALWVRDKGIKAIVEQTKPKKAKKWSKWIKNTTGKQPVADGIVVKTKFARGSLDKDRADAYWWADKALTHYKVQLKDQENPKSKWTKNTGVCPVDGDIEVEFKRRDGDKYKDEAGECDWQLQGQDYDIIKWRLAD